MATAKKRGEAYTARQIAFLEENYQYLTTRQLTEAFNRRYRQDRTHAAIRAALKNRGITCGNRSKPRPSLFTDQQIHWLKRCYQKHTAPETLEKLNEKFGLDIKLNQFKAFVKNHGINCGRTGRFGKGHVPANKGTRRPGWGPGRMKKTQFKPGHVPPNQKEMYHERIDSKDGYILMKVPITNPHTGFFGHYVHKHRWIWEQANGPIPDGYVLVFIDGDKLNVELGNLELIPRGELARRNRLKISEADPEVRDTIRAIARLQHVAGQRAREAS